MKHNIQYQTLNINFKKTLLCAYFLAFRIKKTLQNSIHHFITQVLLPQKLNMSVVIGFKVLDVDEMFHKLES